MAVEGILDKIRGLVEGFTGLDDIDAISNKKREMDGLGESTQRTTEGIVGLGEATKQAFAAPASHVTRDLDATGNAAKRAKKEINETKNELELAEESFNSLAKTVASGGYVNELTKGFDVISKTIGPVAAMFAQNMDNMDKAAGAFATIGLAKVEEGMHNLIDTQSKKVVGIGLIEMQKQLLAVEKALHDTTMSLGAFDLRNVGEDATNVFKLGADRVEIFRDSISKAILNTRMSGKEVLAAQKDLGRAWSVSEMIDPLNKYQEAMAGVTTQVNVLESALLAAAGTGMETTEMTNMLTEAKINLGMRSEEVVTTLGKISLVAKGSGRTFSDVMKNVYKSAESLKYYGTTMEAITPLFETFNKSLKGMGKEGLTPELLEQFVGGLKQMSLSTRSLIAMQIPGMQGGGVLGGGLRMEQAMETGEGMADVMSGISETLKKFGGPRILTREEAIADPTQERNYIVQRQLLGQLTKNTDPAQQDIMLGLLKDIEETGVSSSGDAVQEYRRMMEGGINKQKDTTDQMTTATLKVEAAVLKKGEDVITAIRESMGGVLHGITTRMGDTTEAAARGENFLPAAMNMLSGFRESAGMKMHNTKNMNPPQKQGLAESTKALAQRGFYGESFEKRYKEEVKNAIAKAETHRSKKLDTKEIENIRDWAWRKTIKGIRDDQKKIKKDLGNANKRKDTSRASVLEATSEMIKNDLIERKVNIDKTMDASKQARDVVDTATPTGTADAAKSVNGQAVSEPKVDRISSPSSPKITKEEIERYIGGDVDISKGLMDITRPLEIAIRIVRDGNNLYAELTEESAKRVEARNKGSDIETNALA